MAPSPELGLIKPKAPDKVDTKQCSIDGTNNEMDTLKSSNTTQQSENLDSWDDTELRKLLDEAITYKRPKDREHKSETFRELLHNAEQEDKDRINCISNRILGRSVRGSNRHTQGGSLQDLVETVKQDQLLENDCLIGNHSRRQHNSRQKKYSSVSTRQREGGSLPSNVNCNPYEDHFSNDFGKRGTKNEKTILMSAPVTSRQECVNRADDSQLDGKVTHTVIEIGDGDIDETCHLLAHDSLAQDPHSSDEGTELNPMKKLPRLPMNYTTHQYLNLEMMSEARIDKTVQFSSLKCAGKSTDNNAIQLNSSYPAVNSCIDSKSMSGLPLGPTQNAKFSTYHHPQNIHLIEHKSTDENGNAVQTFNSTLQSSGQLTKHKDGKKKKTERNIKSTIVAKDIEGNRGADSINVLVSFIESRDTSRKNGVINNNVSKTVLPLDKKGKKGSADHKKENSGNNKLKKYNSMENLKSTSKMEDENAQSESGRESAVVLRHKQQMKKAAEMKENNKQQQQQKRGERRSWGTEELTYLGDASSKETSGRDNDQIRKTKDCQKTNRKKDEQSESLVSTESISTLNETAEFRVVTKKKKSKKKQEDMRQKQYNCPSQHPHIHGRLRYQSTHTYPTNRDAYLTPFNANDNRRKSTSSVPPSEKSDNSDLDSVHSLPIESTTRTNNNIQQTPTSAGSNTQAASYAEIARISQQDKQGALAASLDKWPTVSSGKNPNPESPDNSNMSTCSTLSAKSQSSVRGNKFFPEPNEMPNAIHDIVLTNSTKTPTSNNTALKVISYSQSLTEDKQQKPLDVSSKNEEVIKRSTNSLGVAPSKVDVGVKAASDTSQKSPLQKSKSVDNDNYVNMNIDHYPALEKTVKPQKQYQSMPAVQTNNINANQINVAISSTKPTSKPTKSSSQSQSTNVIKSIDSTATNPSKKTRSTSINLANQTPPKGQSDASPELTFNQIDQTKSVKSPKLVDISDTTFNSMIHTTSTTKKIVKNDKIHRNTTSNRPAVIILDSNKYGHNVSPLQFGDFNEDEVRQWRLGQEDSNQSFIMSTNHHYDQTTQTTATQQTVIQPPPTTTTTDTTTITNDKLLSPQSDLGYSSSHSRNNFAPESCDISSTNSIISIDQTLDVASNHIETNVRCSSSCSNSIGQDQSNNNTEPKLDNNSCSSSVCSNHTTDEILAKHPLNVNNVSTVQPGREKMFGRELNIRYIEPPLSNLDSLNHDKLVNFIGLAWEDIKDGAEFYNGQ